MSTTQSTTQFTKTNIAPTTLLYTVLWALLLCAPFEVVAQKVSSAKKARTQTSAKKKPTATKPRSTNTKTTTQSKEETSAKQQQQEKQRKEKAEAKELANRKKELSSLQRSIQQDRKKIQLLADKEASTAQAIAAYQKQSQKMERLVQLIEEEIEDLKTNHTNNEAQQGKINGDLWRLRKRYTELILRMAKEGAATPNEVLLTGKGANDVNATVLQRITQTAEAQSKQLRGNRDSIAGKAQQLLSAADKQAVLLQVKNREQAELDKLIAIKRKALEKIRTDKKEITAQLKKKEKGAAQVQKMIGTLVSTEQRKKGNATKAVPSTVATSAPAIGDFRTKGLPYPVASKKLLHGFGTYTNKITGTQTNNPGIDISANRGSAVKAVSEGKVSLISWLPGYGSVIILDHGNGYRSVYANLASVATKKGAQVQAGSMLGKSGESVDGEFLHFELWYNKQRLNPTAYLH